MNIDAMSQVELAAFVQNEFQKNGIRMVLTGGAAVAYYSSDKYTSLDIDLVDEGFASDQKIRQTMQEMGFSKPAKHFAHPQSKYLVEFVAGPLSVGEERVKKIEEASLATGTLRVISPTDCVKDRLAAYYHWNDQSSLQQAVLVAQAQSVELDEIKRWSNNEGKSQQFADFIAALRTQP